MKQKLGAIIVAVAVALTMAVVPANAGKQWAIATGYTSIYMLNLESGGLTNEFDVLNGGKIQGVAIWNDYVFVADGSSGSGTLHIGQIDTTGLTPKINWRANTVSLGALVDPGAVAVDATGGVYVISKSRITDGSGTHSYVGYLPYSSGTWSQAGFNLFDRPTGFLADIAATGSGSQALIAHRDVTDSSIHWADQSWVSGVNSGGLTGEPYLPEDKGYDPRGITVGGGLAYMVNHLTEIEESGAQERGSISVLSTTTLQKVVDLAIGTGTFMPTDVSYFSAGGINYLGIVGTTANGPAQAWRITLDANGIPQVTVNESGGLTGGGVLTHTLTNSDAFCTVSPDGTTFWVTSPATGTITALDTSTWQGVDLTVEGGPRYIAAYTPAEEPVPEPSSMLAVLTGLVGLAGALKRRRQ